MPSTAWRKGLLCTRQPPTAPSNEMRLTRRPHSYPPAGLNSSQEAARRAQEATCFAPRLERRGPPILPASKAGSVDPSWLPAGLDPRHRRGSATERRCPTADATIFVVPFADSEELSEGHRRYQPEASRALVDALKSGESNNSVTADSKWWIANTLMQERARCRTCCATLSPPQYTVERLVARSAVSFSLHA